MKRASVQRAVLISATLVASFLSPSAAAADDAGLFFRSTLGVGHSYAHAEATEEQPDLAMQAWAPALVLSPGYEFAQGLSLHADLFASMHFAHRLNADDQEGGYDPTGIGMMAFTLGVGTTYQPRPGSLYLSAGVGFSELWGTRWQVPEEQGQLETTTAASYPGYALYGSAGRLFELHSRWSLGPSLNYNFQSVGRPSEDDLTFSRAHTVWLGFSLVLHPNR